MPILAKIIGITESMGKCQLLNATLKPFYMPLVNDQTQHHC
jgi:hypothetical protein